MIYSRITSKAQTTIPKAVREALGITVGDTIAYDIRDGVVTLRPVPSDDDDLGTPFASFTEWADDLDSAYDNL